MPNNFWAALRENAETTLTKSLAEPQHLIRTSTGERFTLGVEVDGVVAPAIQRPPESSLSCDPL